MMLTFICTENSCVDCARSVNSKTQCVIVLQICDFRQFVIFEAFVVTEFVITYFVII
jgi:hypothetical protein